MSRSTEMDSKRVRRFFDNISYRRDRVWYPTQYSWELDKLMSLVDLNDKAVLDVGCGAGNLALSAAARGGVVFASDVLLEATNATKCYAKELGVSVSVVQSDGLEYWLSGKEKFDVVVCNPPSVDVLSEETYCNDNPFYNSYLLINVVKKYRDMMGDRGCFLSAVSGAQNMEFIKSKITGEVEPCVLYRRVPVEGVIPGAIEELAAGGLVDIVNSKAYWNAYFFGLFHF